MHERLISCRLYIEIFRQTFQYSGIHLVGILFYFFKIIPPYIESNETGAGYKPIFTYEPMGLYSIA